MHCVWPTLFVEIILARHQVVEDVEALAEDPLGLFTGDTDEA
jgi:hypothetical protein